MSTITYRILPLESLYNDIYTHSYKENTVTEFNNLYIPNLKLIDSWLNDTDNTINKIINYFILKYPDNSEYYIECKLEIYKNIALIKANLIIVKTLFKNNYLLKYFESYYANNKAIFMLTTDGFKEYINTSGDIEFVIKDTENDIINVNNRESEEFNDCRIEHAFMNCPDFNGWTITNKHHEPMGKNQCPDTGYTIYEPSGLIFGRLYLESKTVGANINEYTNKLMSPDYNSAGKSNDNIEECFLPMIKKGSIWIENPCFFAIVFFTHYCKLKHYDRSNNKHYNILQYYMTTPHMLQLSIIYRKDEDIIKIALKASKNGNTLLSPKPLNWISYNYEDIYDFHDKYIQGNI